MPALELLESRRLLSVNIATFPLRGEGTYPEGIATGAGADQNIWFTLSANGGNIGMINPNDTSAGVTQYPIPTDGSGPGPIAPGPDGNYWFFEETADQFGVINPTTGHITEIPLLTTADPQVDGITTGPNGTVWFTEYNADKVGMIDTANDQITEFPVITPGAEPYGIVEGPDGNIWFTESGVNKVGMINPTTHVMQEYPIDSSGTDQAEGIAVGPDLNLWFTLTGTDKIGVMNPTKGAMVAEYSVPTANAKPDAIAIGPAKGAMWFTESGADQIAVISTTGVVSEAAAYGTNSTPIGITSGADGGVWYVESNHVGIEEYKSGASTSYPYTVTKTDAPFGIAPDSQGNLWFAQQSDDQVGVFDPATDVSTEEVVPTYEAGPLEVAQGPGSSVWFTEFGDGAAGDKIGMIDSATGKITETSVLTPDAQPYDIVYDPVDGNLWFTEWAPIANKVGRINPTTKSVSEFSLPTPNAYPEAITVDAAGNVWFLEPSVKKIAELSPNDPSVINEYNVPGDGGGIVAGPDGNIWFTENVSSVWKVAKFSPATDTVLAQYPVVGGVNLTAITVGPDQNLWFTDGSGRIDTITTAGVLNYYPVPNAIPSVITRTADGNLWFTAAGTAGHPNVIGVVTLTPATIPTQLAVMTQPPAAVTAANGFGLVISVENAAGDLDPDYTGSVTITLASNPGGDTLGGTLTAPVSRGVAVFRGLTLRNAAVGYTIQATATGLTSATTDAFNVTLGATSLQVTTQPPASVGAETSFGLTVSAVDGQGNVDTTYNGPMTLTLGSHPAGSALGGSVAVGAANGVATFAGLTLSVPGDYTIVASSGDLTPAATVSFIVTGAGVAAIGVSSSLPNSTYGQSASFTVTVSGGGPAPTGTVQFVVDGSDLGGAITLSGGSATSPSTALLSAGSHMVVAEYSGDTNYMANTGNYTQVVNPAPVSIVPNNLSRTLGQPNPTLTYTLSGLVNGENATSAGITGAPDLATPALADSPAGQYPITVTDAGTLAAANYDFPAADFETGTLTVTQGTVAVGVSSSLQSSTYGQSVSFTVTVTGGGPAPSGTVRFVVDGSDLGGAITLSGGSATSPSTTLLSAGSHMVVAEYPGDPNYAADTGSYTQFVSPAALSIVPDNLSRAVGRPNPVLAYTLSGFVNGENAASAGITGAPDLATPPLAGAPAGPYPITVTDAGTLAAANYDFPAADFETGTLTVTQGAVTVAVSSSLRSSTYGQSVSFTVTVTGGGPAPTGTVQFVVDGSDLGGAITLSGGSATSPSATLLSAGSHMVVAEYSGDTNYMANTGNDTQVVNPDPVSIVPNNLSRTLGQTNPTLTYTLSGFVNGENAASAGITGAPDLATPASTDSPAGRYPITVTDAGTLAAANYDFPAADYETGTLTVTQGTVTVGVSSSLRSSTYGQSVSFTVTVTGGGPAPSGTVQFVVDGSDLGGAITLAGGSSTSPSTTLLSAGSHMVAAVYSGDPNYMGNTGNYTQVVNPASVSILPNNLSRTPGQPNPTLTYTLSGLVNGENAASAGITGAPDLATPASTDSPAGQYPITVTDAGTLAAANYDFPAADFETGTLTVKQGAVTVGVSPSLRSSTYGQSVSFTVTVTGSGPAPSGTVQFVVDGSDLGGAITLSGGSATSPSTTLLSAGSRMVVAEYSGDPNYAADTGSYTQFVSPAALSIVPNNISRAVDWPNPVLAYTLSGFVNGENAKSAGITGAPDLATPATSGSAAGQYPISVTDAGTLAAANYDFPAADFARGTLTVAPVTPVISVTRAASSMNPSFFGQSVTFDATVGLGAGGSITPAGTITFYDGNPSAGGSKIGSQAVSGGSASITTSALTVSAAGHAIYAVYTPAPAESADINGVTSTPLLQTVSGDQTAISVSSSANRVKKGKAVTLTAVVSNASTPSGGVPAGTVVFEVDGRAHGRPMKLSARGKAVYAKVKLPFGTHVVTVLYTPGDIDFASSQGTLVGGLKVKR